MIGPGRKRARSGDEHTGHRSRTPSCHSRTQNPKKVHFIAELEENLVELGEDPNAQFQYEDDICNSEYQDIPQSVLSCALKELRTFRHSDEIMNLFAKERKGRHGIDDNGKDDYVCRLLASITRAIWRLAEEEMSTFDRKTIKDRRTYLSDLLDNPDNLRTIRWIGCLAIGGPHGLDSWMELLTDKECRQAIFVGLIGRALKEWVFDKLWYGGPPALVAQLHELEIQGEKKGDGFSRTKGRAGVALKFGVGDAPPEARQKTVQDLFALLRPLLSPRDETLPDLMQVLYQIVSKAAELNHLIRMAPDTIYYWPPTFKDEEFEPARMECMNLDEMISNSPYERKYAKDGYAHAVQKPGNAGRSEAIVRVVCFPGLVAYRQKGGSLAKKEIKEEKRIDSGHQAPPDVLALRRRMRTRDGEELTGDEGIRSKVICKSVVLLQWGTRRLLTKTAGTSAHMDALSKCDMHKYQDDAKGYTELFDEFWKRSEKNKKAVLALQNRKRVTRAEY